MTTKIYDVWAAWCGPCKRFAPIFERAAANHPEIQFIKVNGDLEHEFLQQHGIQSIPTILVERNGEIVFRHTGILSEAALENVITNLAMPNFYYS